VSAPRVAPPRLLAALRRYYDNATRKVGAVPPCALPDAALCSTGVAMLVVYGTAPVTFDLPRPAGLPGLATLAHLPLEGAPPIASERFEAWLSRHGERVGKIGGRFYDLAELRRAWVALPYCKSVALGAAELTRGATIARPHTHTTHVLLVDGDGWRIALAEISYPEPLKGAPEWDSEAEDDGKEAVAA
jgi:hypothetical protein